MKKQAKKSLTQQQQIAAEMQKKQRRCLTVAKNLRLGAAELSLKAAELIKEAERNEANASGYGQVVDLIERKGQ